MDSEALANTVFISIILSIVMLGHFIRRFKYKYATEGTIALLLGLVVGGIYYLYFVFNKSDTPVPFALITSNSNVFFHVLLPPIIFYAGFSVKKKLFFRNFTTISAFGILGTFFYTTFITLGTFGVFKIVFKMPSDEALSFSLAMGAIFSCSDTVATLQVLDQEEKPVLYSLVFGEGVVNDATAIVLLGAVQKMTHATRITAQLYSVVGTFAYLFFASLTLGVGIGLISSLVIRHAFRQHSTDREVLVVALMGFLAYSIAETIDLSAILSVFFCGITMSHYTYYNMSESAQSIAHHSFRIISAVMEIVLFTYGGLDMWLTALWRTSTLTTRNLSIKIAALSLCLLVCIILARAIFIFPVVAIANRVWHKKTSQISHTDAVVIWWSGMCRGAITLALTYHEFYSSANVDSNKQVVIAATIVVVLMTTVVLGMVTGPFLEYLMSQDDDAPSITSLSESGLTNEPLMVLLDGASPSTRVPRYEMPRVGERRFLHKMWHNFDHAVMQPVFGGSSQHAKHPGASHFAPGLRLKDESYAQLALAQQLDNEASSAAKDESVDEAYFEDEWRRESSNAAYYSAYND